MGSAFAAGAGADALRDVIRAKFTEQQDAADRKRLREQDDRQQAMDVENTRRWNQNYTRQLEADKGLADSRAAEAARDRAAAEKDANRQKGLAQLMSDPAAWQAMNPVQRVVALQQHGVNNLPYHEGIETPEEHGKHVAGDAKRKADDAFEQYTRTRDYAVSHPLRPVPVSRLGRPPQDDPSLPLGSQRYIAQIASKHGNDWNGARAELEAYINDPSTQRDHPNLSPLKAIEALKKIARGPSGSGDSDDELDSLITEATARMGRGAAPGAGPVPVARLVNGRLQGAQSVGGSTAAVSDAQLAAQAAQVLQGQGYAATPENIRKFLSIPGNRQRLSSAQGQ